MSYKVILSVTTSNGLDENVFDAIVNFRNENQFADYEADGFEELKDGLEFMLEPEHYIQVIEFESEADEFQETDLDVSAW